MSSLLADRLGSDIFELITEDGRKSFFVHKNLLTSQSAILRSLVDAATAERKLDLLSWDAETVKHFVNFLYLHTYAAVEPGPFFLVGDSASETTNTESQVHTPETVRSDDTIQPEASSDNSAPRPLTPISKLWDSAEDIVGDVKDCNTTARLAEDVYHVNYPQEIHHYHETLLSHARIYSLAQSLGVDALCSMAYNRLMVILRNFKPINPGSRIAVDIVELVRYVYANTQGTGNMMRKLVSQFAVLNITAVRCTEEMKQLVRQDSQLAVDMVEKVCRRLVASEDERDRYREMATSLEPAAEKLQVEQKNCMALKERIISLEKEVEDMRLAGQQQQQILSDMTHKLTATEMARDENKKEVEKVTAALKEEVDKAAAASNKEKEKEKEAKEKEAKEKEAKEKEAKEKEAKEKEAKEKEAKEKEAKEKEAKEKEKENAKAPPK